MALAGCGLIGGFVYYVEESTVGDLAGWVGALVDGGLKERLIPAWDEIAMVPIACFSLVAGLK